MTTTNMDLAALLAKDTQESSLQKVAEAAQLIALGRV